MILGVGPYWGPYWGGWGYPYYYPPYGYYPPDYGYGYGDGYDDGSGPYPGGDSEYAERPPDHGGPPADIQTYSQSYWYYCPSAHGYYPNVKHCSQSWIPVPARTDRPGDQQ